MVGDHGTSERVYARLKADLLGAAGISDRLNINAMAQRYDASTTPVREALLRLVGEGVVEMPASGGFVLPRIDPKTAGDHYELGLVLALAVISRMPPGPESLALDLTASRLHFPIDAVLTHLAHATGNAAIALAVAASNDRLHPIRVMEEMRLPNLEPEFAQVLRSAENNDKVAMRTSIAKYYRRRLRNITKTLGLSA